LATGTYMFEALFALRAMSATSGNCAFDILGAGTAVLADVLYHAIGQDAAPGATAVNQTGGVHIQGQTVASMVTAATQTEMFASLRGTFEVTTGGTIIPSVTLVTAAAAIVRAGSFFRIRRVGAAGVATVGAWD
jgi:hypothetical protein